jgi:hypothetical protein
LSFRVELHKTALAQLQGLPERAFDELIQCMADVCERPWDTMGVRPSEPEFRQAIFGIYGLVSFYVDDLADVIRVYDVTWIG